MELVAACLVALVSLIGGLICLLRWARTGRRFLLLTGLLLTIVVPGIVFACAILIANNGTWPQPVYGPGPTSVP